MALVPAKSLRELKAQMEVSASEIEATLKDYARSLSSINTELIIKIVDKLNQKGELEDERISRMLRYCRTGKRSDHPKTRKEYIAVSEHLKSLRS